MKKRLRKKLRLQEFQEMGFAVTYDLAIPETDEEQLYAFWDRLVAAVKANHLMMGGGLNDFAVQTDSRRSATDDDRTALRSWLEQQPEVSNVVVGPLYDNWHGKFE